MNPSDPAPKPKPCTFAMHSDPVENVCVGVCARSTHSSVQAVANFALGDHQQGRTGLAVYDAEKNGQGASRHTQESSDINPSLHVATTRARSSFHLVRNVNWQKRPLFLARWCKILLLGTTRPACRESRTQMGQTSLYSSTTCVSSPLRGRFHRRGLHRVHGIVHSNVFFF